jgi:hypothetical protein
MVRVKTVKARSEPADGAERQEDGHDAMTHGYTLAPRYGPPR